MQSVRVGVVGCGTISGIYLEEQQARSRASRSSPAPTSLPERAAARAAEYGVPARAPSPSCWPTRRSSVVLNLTTPAGPRRGRAGGAGGRQVGLQREAARHRRARRRSSCWPRRARAGRARRLRAGHVPRRRLADLPQADRRRRDRRAGRGDRLHAQPRPRELAPRPRLLLPGGRRAAVRHGAVLPDRADLAARPGAARDRLGADHLPGADDHAASRKHGETIAVETPTHVAGVLDFASGAIAHAGHQLRRLGQPACRASRSTAPRALSACPTRTPSADRCACAGRGETEWSDVPLTHAYTENSRGLGVGRHGRRAARRPAPPRQRRPGLPRPRRHARHPRLIGEAGRHVTLASTCDRPAPLPLGLLEGRLDS